MKTAIIFFCLTLSGCATDVSFTVYHDNCSVAIERDSAGKVKVCGKFDAKDLTPR